jgi:hypothetical protein
MREMPLPAPLSADDFLGTWEMVSLRRMEDGAFNRFPMGEGAWGRIIYGPDTMSAFIMSAAWHAGDDVPAFENLVSYAAHWEFDAGVVRHQVLAASVASWIGTTLVRQASRQPDGTLLLCTAPHVKKNGALVHDELLWRRIDPAKAPMGGAAAPSPSP